MNDFRFAQLNWLHAAWAVLALACALAVFELRGRAVLDRMISPLMQRRLVFRASLFRRLAAIGLVSAALLAMVFAMMRPQWGKTVQAASRIDSQIMVCLDVSKSMLAEDAVPNRLDRAKAELDSLLGMIDDGQQVGLTAFAGKAAVVCPLTTDFGFLRLVLDEVGPQSVGLGGTKIGEALQKAVNGFRDAGDVNRLILLITDGEDHDSFPLDAAKLARERGIRVVCIGFGDEAGSKIQITDPESGARSFVKDANGRDVISRLDGETLREIALQTEGAYIPAGTGALDLESIYQAHIKTLLSGVSVDEQRVIRNEAYQWCVLAALVLLLAALLTANPFALKARAIVEAERRLTVSSEKATLLCLLLALTMTEAATAQSPPAAPAGDQVETKQTAKESDQKADEAESSASQNSDARERSPREAYNDAIALLSSDYDEAERMLSRARRDAGIDGELRFRSLYNLGWVEVNRADELVEEKPQDALTHLQQAANRFREAIRVRPEGIDARHNLEIISRRILELTDALAKRDPRNLETRLDELIKQQREHQRELQDQVTRDDLTSATSEAQRREFRQLGVKQRQIISDMQKFADDARREADALGQKQTDQQASEDRLRAAQLTAMLARIDGSLQRMNKARSLTRRTQAERAFVRWSAALTDAKRGRDQLRNPIEVLGILIQDTAELAGLTRAKSQATAPQLNQQQVVAPPWLTKDYLQQTNESTGERTAELTAILAAGAQESPDEPETQTPDPQAELLAKNIKRALPSMRKAQQALGDASSEIEAENFAEAFSMQAEAIIALNEAAEHFYDLRRLIEVMYRDEQMVKSSLERLTTQPAQAESFVSVAKDSQKKNLNRSARLDEMLDFEMSKLPAPAAGPREQGGPSAAPEEADAERKKLESARKLLGEATEQMNGADNALKDVNITEPDVGAAGSHVVAAIEKIEALRRLFFSIAEQLRETAQRQADLNDKTNDLAGKPDQQKPERVGPLENRQRQLEQKSQEIAEALAQQAEQAKQAAENPTGQDQGQAEAEQQAEQAKQAAAAMEQAATLVQEAQQSMQTAADALKPEAPSPDEQATLDFDAIARPQQTALEKLVEALALLDNRQQNQNQDQQQQNQQQNQDQSQQNQDQQEQNRDQQQDNMNAAQLLQLIRDREAQRRKDRQRVRGAAGAVDKDW